MRTILLLALVLLGGGGAAASEGAGTAPEVLPGTEPLTADQPLDEWMVGGIERYALGAIEQSVAQRAERWKRDYSDPTTYAASVAANRQRLRTVLGAVDPREPDVRLQRIAEAEGPVEIAESEAATVSRVRWRVLEGVTAEGLLLRPRGEPRARVIALPDADWTPESFVGLVDGVAPSAQLPRALADSGCEVLVPMLLSRSDRFSGHPEVRWTNQPHREFVYRMAFQMGRHVIGYEVQKVLAAVDAFSDEGDPHAGLPIGVVGVGEGGLLAMHAAALDERIAAAMVCGYFQQREGLWEEPIYRNVWRLLSEFGDAEVASLIAPRGLVVEACAAPEVDGPPAPRDGRTGAAPGRIVTPPLESVRAEADRAAVHFEKLDLADRFVVAVSGQGRGTAGSGEALAAFLPQLDGELRPADESEAAWQRLGSLPDAERREQRQFWELVEFTQRLHRRSARARDAFWADADRSSPEAWVASTERYKQHLWEEMIGKLPEPTMPPNVRTRRVLEEPEFVGYEVVIDVLPDVIASGILLLPRDLSPDAPRAAVVCQHGLEGTPMDTITSEGRAGTVYKSMSAELARRGFVVYAPQNPYRGGDAFRVLQRQSNPLGRSLFSYILAQHQRTLEWLGSLPGVDPQRIGFYGLSYGGKTAVRVPPLLPGYALSICSADFNEWILKNVSSEDRYSYMFTGEYEMFEWNMGHLANYAELANLMAPRPFMVERGHHDGVAPDEWVAWEFAKVRRHYTLMGLGDRAEIEYFDGPHAIHGQGTYEFIERYLGERRSGIGDRNPESGVRKEATAIEGDEG